MEKQEGGHLRAISEASEVRRVKPSTRTHLSPSLAAGSIDEALEGVRRDIQNLWIRSRYMPDLSGIVTFSPSLQKKPTEKKQKRVDVPTIATSTPFQVTVQAKQQTSNRLRVSSPNPAFPSPKPRQSYTLKKVPQPLFLHRPATKLREKKGKIDLVSCLPRGVTEREITSRTEDCPLTALRSYELERKNRDLRAFSSFQLNAEDRINPLSAAMNKQQSFLSKPLRFLQRPQAAQQPAWNLTCLKISKVSPYPSHQKAASHSWHFPTIPHISSDSEEIPFPLLS